MSSLNQVFFAQADGELSGGGRGGSMVVLSISLSALQGDQSRESSILGLSLSSISTQNLLIRFRLGFAEKEGKKAHFDLKLKRCLSVPL